MAAPMMSGLKLLREPLTYSKIKTLQRIVRCQRLCDCVWKRSDKTFFRDSEGAITGVQERKFPQHVAIDPEEEKKFYKDEANHFRRHGGIMRLKTVHLPDFLYNNLRLVLAENDSLHKGFEADCKHLREVFKHRHPPTEKEEFNEKFSSVIDKVIQDEVESRNISLENLSKEDQEKLGQKVDTISRKTFYASHHTWKPVRYSGKDAYVYAAARLPANYAVMLQVLLEIRRDNPDYVPDLVYNYGSGACSAVWATETIWKNKVFDYYCVDTSRDMIKLAKRLITKDTGDTDNSSKKPVIENVHFKMFPSSSKNGYSLVVSGYLLHEMLQKQRQEFVQTLWTQTEDYLVLVEYGTASGYRLIMEARNNILDMMKTNPDLEGHVIAPCTHDEICPKQIMKNPVCNFDVTYAEFPFTKKMTQNFLKETEKYIYVIFKKGKNVKGQEYPRILGKKVGARRSACLLCCPDGKMNNFVIGKGASSKALYWSLKKAGSGDLLPVMWSQFNSEIYEEERQGQQGRGDSYSDDDSNN